MIKNSKNFKNGIGPSEMLGYGAGMLASIVNTKAWQ